MNRGLPIWKIYERPPDAPDGFVVRRWMMEDGVVTADSVSFQTRTLEEARALVPPGLFLMPQYEGEEPCVREVWL